MTECYRMPAANGCGIEMLRYRDVHIQKAGGVDPKLSAEYLVNFEYRQRDIFLCSFPKSGTHWIGTMIWKLKTLDESDPLVFNVVEFRQYELYEQRPPRLMITHLRPNHLPQQHLHNNGKIVLMLRNPKDVCVSYYHHLKDAIKLSSGQTWDECFNSFIDGNCPSGSYIEYLKEWDKLLNDKANGSNELNVKVLFYESCKKNKLENITKLNEFLQFNRDTEYLEKVLEVTSFNSMKTADNERKEKIHPLCSDKDGNSIIYRKGMVGGWKDYFTVAQSELMDKLLNEKLQYGMIKFEQN